MLDFLVTVAGFLLDHSQGVVSGFVSGSIIGVAAVINNGRKRGGVIKRKRKKDLRWKTKAL
ncbi:hypothetical protein CBW65_06960 [Tumebacillus avium]|uniref:Uncharacterized protein n=1 Tax=Tumebacillus avium TaxID=1903704 RepID=A0A1Y0IMW2_9BACL|nr:hypothetical protein [Tumebacillus avium]ARU60865.1 hypothetical protein CBW65_06960 [Tumebacillus avium]